MPILRPRVSHGSQGVLPMCWGNGRADWSMRVRASDGEYQFRARLSLIRVLMRCKPPRFGSSRCLGKCASLKRICPGIDSREFLGTHKPHLHVIPDNCAWEKCYPCTAKKRAFILPRNNNRRISAWLEYHPTSQVIPRLYLGTIEPAFLLVSPGS